MNTRIKGTALIAGLLSIVTTAELSASQQFPIDAGSWGGRVTSAQ